MERAIETALVSNADIPPESHNDADEENFRNNQISSTPESPTDQPQPVMTPATTNDRPAYENCSYVFQKCNSL